MRPRHNAADAAHSGCGSNATPTGALLRTSKQRTLRDAHALSSVPPIQYTQLVVLADAAPRGQACQAGQPLTGTSVTRPVEA
eukprot:scaffold257374_cov43-Tisochrysis_lutea.AAC.2